MNRTHKETDSHVFIAGPTRGGKTVVANGMHAEFDGVSVFFNSEEEDNIVGYAINNPNQIISAIRRFGWDVKLSYYPQGTLKEHLNYELTQVINLIFDLANRTGRKRPIQILVDECQDYAEQGKSETALHKLVRKGAKRKLKGVPISQDPARVSKTVIRQCYYNIWCGEFNAYYMPYFRRYKLPVHVLENQENHYYTLFKGADVVASYQKENSRYA